MMAVRTCVLAILHRPGKANVASALRYNGWRQQTALQLLGTSTAWIERPVARAIAGSYLKGASVVYWYH